MSGVLVVAEVDGDTVRPRTLELIAAASSLSSEGAGAVSVLVLAAEPQPAADAVDRAGVDEILLADSPLPYFEAHVTQVAVAAVIRDRSPSVVLASHAVESFAFAPALAAAARLGLATDVAALRWTPRGLHARRGAYAQRLVCELDFSDRPTTVILLRVGVFAPAVGDGAARRTPVQLDLTGSARSQRLELRPPAPLDIDITTAPFLLALGRGVVNEERFAGLEQLAERLGATVCVTRPLVDAGWASRARQIGQSGRSAAPLVYLALGVSGAPQHVAGIAGAKTIIAVNSDPHAPIFAIADYGAVADLFEVAGELAKQLEHRGDDGLH